MAQMSKSAWEAFVKVNDLYESGKLKDQKCSQSEIAKGTLALKKWHMKPIVSLPDNSKVYLLNKASGNDFIQGLRFHMILVDHVGAVTGMKLVSVHMATFSQVPESGDEISFDFTLTIEGNLRGKNASYEEGLKGKNQTKDKGTVIVGQ